MSFHALHSRTVTRTPPARRRGVAAILAMMFLVIFASLAAAMAVVSQGNLRVAETNIKISRSLAAAETGMNLMVRELEKVTNGDPNDTVRYPGVYTKAGIIKDQKTLSSTVYATSGDAYALWGGDSGQPTTADPGTTIIGAMIHALSGDGHYVDPDEPGPRIVPLGKDIYDRNIKQLYIPQIRFGANSPVFEVRMTPHPLPLDMQPSNEGYDDPYYDRMPFGRATPGSDEEDQKRELGVDFVVGNTEDLAALPPVRPLDARFIRVTVTAIDGPETGTGSVTRSISNDFILDKRVPYAILSNSRLMLGRNVSVKGNVASRFNDPAKLNGNPVEVRSDLEGLLTTLDDDLTDFYAAVGDYTVDADGDNRLNLQNPTEAAAVPAGSNDRDLDGYITEFDYLLERFDDDRDGKVGRREFIETVLADGKDELTAEQLFDLLDEAGSDNRVGHDDDSLSADDLVSKIQGEVSTLVNATDWERGHGQWSSESSFKKDLQGTYLPGFGGVPLNLEDPKLQVFDINQLDFDTEAFADLATNDLLPTTDGAGAFTSNSPAVAEVVNPSDETKAETPFGAEFPYDYYFRPVYRNIVFEDLFIPVGTNARFDNCRFKGVVFIEIEEDNADPDFNRAGMFQQSIDYANRDNKNFWKHDTLEVTVDGDSNVDNTKPFGNNLHFHDCVFEGSIASGTRQGKQPANYTHVRNKVTFTGRTSFDRENVSDPEQRRFFERSSILLPHISVELGSFDEGYDSSEEVELTGAIVAGVVDMRGQVSIRGTLISTFEPVDGVPPVEEGNTPNFNVTLGYFSQDAGDLESASGPRTQKGLGKIRIVYDPSLALPDGIDSPIEARPLRGSYFEGSR